MLIDYSLGGRFNRVVKSRAVRLEIVSYDGVLPACDKNSEAHFCVLATRQIVVDTRPKLV